MTNSTIVWFRQDLRIEDHPALVAANARGESIIPVYIWSPEEEGKWPPGGASQWWLNHALSRLEEQLKSLGSRLIVRQGKALDELLHLAHETDASAVFWTRRYETASIERDKRVKAELSKRGLHAESFKGQLLFEPWEIQTNEGRPYQVFTAFWKSCLSKPEPDEPEPAPERLKHPKKWPESLRISDLSLLPKIHWDAGFIEAWQPAKNSAHHELKLFLKSTADDYESSRDRPADRGTSRLSPFLHFGEISPRMIWHEVHRHYHNHPHHKVSAGANTFLKEIGWREFAHHLLFHFPHTATKPLRSEFTHFPWAKDRTAFKRWKQGQTGYPIVDAGMRELWNTGWMHNRVRMIVASFLVKDLLIPWQRGAEWFWDTLVDADLANNTLGWQWTAGCGADAAPYFRIFNPVLQSEKFDPEGRYLRQWIPELKSLQNKWIHAPWKAPSHELEKLNIQLGQTYPLPIVDHGEARDLALKSFQSLKK